MNNEAKNGDQTGLVDLELILDQIDALVYVSDLNSYRIIYLNKHAKEVYGDVTGQLCWEKLQNGKTDPCELCNKEQAFQGEHPKSLIWVVSNARGLSAPSNRSQSVGRWV